MNICIYIYIYVYMYIYIYIYMYMVEFCFLMLVFFSSNLALKYALAQQSLKNHQFGSPGEGKKRKPRGFLFFPFIGWSLGSPDTPKRCQNHWLYNISGKKKVVVAARVCEGPRFSSLSTFSFAIMHGFHTTATLCMTLDSRAAHGTSSALTATSG